MFFREGGTGGAGWVARGGWGVWDREDTAGRRAARTGARMRVGMGLVAPDLTPGLDSAPGSASFPASSSVSSGYGQGRASTRGMRISRRMVANSAVRLKSSPSRKLNRVTQGGGTCPVGW